MSVLQQRISTNQQGTCKSQSLETIEILSIIKTCENLLSKFNANLSLKLGNLHSKFRIDIPRRLRIAVPSILTDATPVGDSRKTFALSNSGF